MERVRNTVQPVTLQELKSHLRITTEDFDDQLDMYLSAAVAAAENYTNTVIHSSQYSFSYPYTPKWQIPVTPVDSITSVKVDGEELPPEQYSLDCHNVLCVNKVGLVVDVALVAGYNEVPGDIKAAILLKASRLFTNPADSVENLPSASRHLLDPYRQFAF